MIPDLGLLKVIQEVIVKAVLYIYFLLIFFSNTHVKVQYIIYYELHK